MSPLPVRRVTTRIARNVRNEVRALSQGARPGRPLRYGSRGPAVAALQAHLKAVGLYGGPANGKFGKYTRLAVIALQKARQLPPTGMVGPKEVAAVRGLDRFVKPGFQDAARVGQVGSDIKDMENKLRRLGYNPGRVDGRYDAATYRAVKAFQIKHRLAVSGSIGPATQRRIDRERGQQVQRERERRLYGNSQSVLAYSSGSPIRIRVVRVDGNPVEVRTARAFNAMKAAAARAGINLNVVSGFRTMAEQRYLYGLYQSGQGALAAAPGYSNHQNGKALDLNTGGWGTRTYNWLSANAGRFGFSRTVPSEHWHWEFGG